MGFQNRFKVTEEGKISDGWQQRLICLVYVNLSTVIRGFVFLIMIIHLMRIDYDVDGRLRLCVIIN